MNGKKKYIIAIVLFIFIGLMLFTFANPLGDDDSKRLENGDQSDVEDDDSDREDDGQDDDTITDDEDETTDNVINTIPVVDNSYELALQAVINAEEKLDEESYNTALDLVNNVTDNRKEELSDRLEEVKNSIDAIALVEQLESKVNTSADKDDMDDARDFRVDEEIIEKVEALQNANLKSDLQATLDELAKLLNDENEPGINIKDGAILSSKTKIAVEDENNVTITLQNDGSTDSIEIPNGYEVEEGKYSLTVVDAAFNEDTITFTVDYSDPAFNITSGTHSDSDINVVISDLSFDYVEIYNQDENTKVLETKDEFVLTSQATYRLTAYDKLGNKTEIWVAIDKKDPTIDATGTGVGTYFSGDVTLTVFDKFLTEVKVNDDVYTVGDFTSVANNENRTFKKLYTEPGVYDVVAKDKFGHEAEYTFTIDKPIPSVNVKNGGYYKDPITLEITEEYLHEAELTLPNGEKVTVNSGYVIDKQGKYYLKVRDAAYNLLEISFIVDFEAPKFKPNQWNYTLEVDKDAEFTCPDMSEYVTDNLSGVASVVVDKWYSKPDQTKVGTFTCRYISTDKAGNRVSDDLKYTVVDTTDPVITKLVDPDIYFELGDELPPINELVYATDNNDGDITDKVYILKYPDMTKVGTQLVEFYVVDASGNRGYTPLRIHIQEVDNSFDTLATFSGTTDVVSQMRGLRTMALDTTGQYLYLGFIHGRSSGGVRKIDINNGNIVKEISLYQAKGLTTDNRGNVYVSRNTGDYEREHNIRIYDESLDSYKTITVVNDHSSVIQSLYVVQEGNEYYLYIGFNRADSKRYNAINKINVTNVSDGQRFENSTLFTINELLGETTNQTKIQKVIYKDGFIYVATGEKVYKINESTKKIVDSANLDGAYAMTFYDNKLFVTQYLANNSKVVVLNEDLSINNTIDPEVDYPYVGSDSGFSDIVLYNDKIYIANQMYNVSEPNRTIYDRVLVSPKSITSYIK